MSTVLYDLVKTQSKITDSVIVAFSGGKESIVVLDLCFKYFKHVQPYYMYICPNLSFQDKMIKWYENKYDTEIIQIPHMQVCEFFHYGSFRPPDPTFPVVSMNDIYDYIREKTGMYWIAVGERMDDSLIRRGRIHNSSSIDEDRGRLYPVAMWHKKEVLDYITYHRLYRDEYSRKAGFSFPNLAPPELKILKDNFPEDYEKILHLYPFADAGVKRLEAYNIGVGRKF